MEQVVKLDSACLVCECECDGIVEPLQLPKD